MGLFAPGRKSKATSVGRDLDCPNAADDLIRCNMLEGKTFEEVRRLLGPSVYGKEGRYLTYDIGLERDSFFQVDPELLSIGFTKNGIYSAADIYQGNSIRYACPSAISRRSVQA